MRTFGALDLRGHDGKELRGVLSQPKRAALLRNALSQAVQFLRRSLGAEVVVSHNGDSMGLQPGHVWCDVVAFEVWGDQCAVRSTCDREE